MVFAIRAWCIRLTVMSNSRGRRSHKGGSMKSNAFLWAALAGGLLAMCVHPPGLAQAQGTLTAVEAQQIGIEAVVYGLPLVVMDVTKRASTNVPGP